MKYVIIGNGTAATAAVEGIRRVDTKSDITIVAQEKHHTYSRPLISYYLAQKTDRQRIKYRPDDFYTKNECSVLLGRTVMKIDPENKNIKLDDGEVDYSRLLVATGSSSFIPPFKGIETVKEKHTFLSLDDALKLEKKLTKNMRVLIVGAGLIGLKCAEGIAGRAKSITVVDLCDSVLSSILDKQASNMVQAHLSGMDFLLGRTVRCFDGNNALLSDGQRVEFDLLVLAVGVRPNTSLLSQIGGQVGKGIITNEMMQTSIEHIYAAGDCTESFDISSGQSKVLALLPNAYRQGECAGINMAGGQKAFDKAIPLNAIGLFGLSILTAGSYKGACYRDITANTMKKLFYKDNLLKGFILINKTQNAGIYTSLIQNQTPLNTIDFDLIVEQPSLMAFEREHRTKILGGVV